LLDEAAPYDERQHVMRWRHALRRQLLLGRLALECRDTEAALERATAVVTEGRERGVERYVVLGSLVASLARAASGRPDPESAAAAVARLPVVAGGEAWWWQGRLAAACGVDRWRDEARTRVRELSARAGARAPSLERFAASVLD
jgi:hypothetical protein